MPGKAFRIDAYNPSGWVDTDIYHGVDFRTYANCSLPARGAVPAGSAAVGWGMRFSCLSERL